MAATPVSGNIAATSTKKINGTRGLAVDANGAIVVSDTLKQSIIAYGRNTTDGVVVAAGNGKGGLLNQLNRPAGIFIDAFGNLFIADQFNHRVLRFAPGSNTGFLVAGGNGEGNGGAT